LFCFDWIENSVKAVLLDYGFYISSGGATMRYKVTENKVSKLNTYVPDQQMALKCAKTFANYLGVLKTPYI